MNQGMAEIGIGEGADDLITGEIRGMVDMGVRALGTQVMGIKVTEIKVLTGTASLLTLAWEVSEGEEGVEEDMVVGDTNYYKKLTGIADICCVDVGKIVGVKTYDDSGHMNTSAGNADIIDILVDTFSVNDVNLCTILLFNVGVNIFNEKI